MRKSGVPTFPCPSWRSPYCAIATQAVPGAGTSHLAEEKAQRTLHVSADSCLNSAVVAAVVSVLSFQSLCPPCSKAAKMLGGKANLSLQSCGAVVAVVELLRSCRTFQQECTATSWKSMTTLRSPGRKSLIGTGPIFVVKTVIKMSASRLIPLSANAQR